MNAAAWAAKERIFWSEFREELGDDLPARYNDTITDLVSSLLERSIPPDRVASTIAELILDQEDLFKACGRLWSIVINAAKEVSNDVHIGASDLLAELMGQFATLPDEINQRQTVIRRTSVSSRPVEPGEIIAADGVLWKGFPRFRRMMKDEWNAPENMSGPRIETEPFAHVHWTNLNRWVAVFVMRYGGRSPALGSFLAYGKSAIESALEYPEEWAQNGCGLPCLPAACAWIEIAGEKLIRLVGNDIPIGTAGPLWTALETNPEKRGILTKQRWEFWQQRLLALSRDNALEPSTRDAAARAATTLSQISTP